NSARADNGQPGRAGHAPKRVLSRPTWTVSVNQTTVAVSVTLEELITCVLPLSEWWLRNIKDVPGADTRSAEDKVKILPPAATQERARREWNWLAMMAGVLVLCARESVDEDKP